MTDHDGVNDATERAKRGQIGVQDLGTTQSYVRCSLMGVILSAAHAREMFQAVADSRPSLTLHESSRKIHHRIETPPPRSILEPVNRDVAFDIDDRSKVDVDADVAKEEANG